MNELEPIHRTSSVGMRWRNGRKVASIMKRKREMDARKITIVAVATTMT